MELQELITRGRFVFSGAPKRLEAFKLIDGKRSTKEVAVKCGRIPEAVLNDFRKLRDMGLIEAKQDKQGKVIRKGGCIVYDKVSLLRHVPLSYFQDPSSRMTKILPAGEIQKRGKARKLSPLTVPSENEILDICRSGEDQTHEFKAPGIEMDKMSKEIAAFSNTRNGGLIFYGVDDDGTVIGSDKRRQVFDQSLQNSIRNTISPQPNIDIKEKDVLRHKIIVVVVQPWDRKNIYQYRKEQRYYIRRGTNMFAVTPDELKKLGNGEYVV